MSPRVERVISSVAEKSPRLRFRYTFTALCLPVVWGGARAVNARAEGAKYYRNIPVWQFDMPLSGLDMPA